MADTSDGAPVPTSGINVERMVTDHVPPTIDALEMECTDMVSRLLRAEARLVRLKILQRIMEQAP